MKLLWFEVARQARKRLPWSFYILGYL